MPGMFLTASWRPLMPTSTTFSVSKGSVSRSSLMMASITGLVAFPNRLDVGRVPIVERAIQIGTRAPWLLRGPNGCHIKVADGCQISAVFRVKYFGIDAELLPLLHGSHGIAYTMVGKYSFSRIGDLPGLAIRQQPLAI